MPGRKYGHGILCRGSCRMAEDDLSAGLVVDMMEGVKQVDAWVGRNDACVHEEPD